MADFLNAGSESIWMDKWRVQQAEALYHSGGQGATGADNNTKGGSASALIKEIEQARQQIQKSLKSDAPSTKTGDADPILISKLQVLEKENSRISGVVDELRLVVKNLENRIIALESSSKKSPASAPAPVKDNKDDEDSDDSFNLDSDEDDDKEAEKLKQKRLDEYAARKAKKPVLIAKSNIILDVKPWDDETDMKEVENAVRTITMDGLLWGASKLVAIGYGIKKLQISCVVEDDKVSTDDLEEQICDFEDLVQSVDIAAFNKV